MERAEEGLEQLCNEQLGMHCNRCMDTGELRPVLLPTNFYALFSDRVDERRQSMEECYFAPEVFYGEWMIPFVMRSHPAYLEQQYWRGKIWAR